MPTYEYLCSACNHSFEEYQSITAKPIRKCPSCGQRKVKRLIGTGAGVIFKGSGFYETDYRSANYRKGAKAESDSRSKASDQGKGSDSGKSSGSDKSGASSQGSGSGSGSKGSTGGGSGTSGD